MINNSINDQYNQEYRLGRSIELHTNVFWEDDVDNTRVNESEVM